MLSADVNIFAGAAGSGSLDQAFLASNGQLSFATPDAGSGAALDTLSTGALAQIDSATSISIQAVHAITFGDLGGGFTLPTAAGAIVSFSTDDAGGGDITFSNPGDTLSTSGGSLFFDAGANLTLAGLNTAGGNLYLVAASQAAGALAAHAVQTTGGAGGAAGNVIFTADSLSLAAPVNAGSARVTVQPYNNATAIVLGSASSGGLLGLTDAELSQITAGVVQIGNAIQSGGITVNAPIANHPGYDTLSLRTLGAITNAVSLGTALTAPNISLQAGSGIGAGGALTVDAAKLAFSNGLGDVNIASSGSLTIDAVDGTPGGANPDTDATTSLSAAGPITFAASVYSGNTLQVTASESASESGNQPENNVIVNGQVNLGAGSKITLTAADQILAAAGSVINAPGVNLYSGADDTDGDAWIDALGTIEATDYALLVTNGDLRVNSINAPGALVTLASNQGAILDANDSPAVANNVTAATLYLEAAKGIGVTATGIDAAAAPLEVSTSHLGVFNSASGDIQVVNQSGDVSVSGFNSAPGGKINLAAFGGGALAINSANLSSKDGDITLVADRMSFGGAVDAGHAVVTLEQATGTVNIDLGTNPSSGALGLSQTDLNYITAAELRIGDAAHAGEIKITAAIAAPAGWNTLLLLSGGQINGGNQTPLTVANLDVQGLGGVALLDGAVSTLAGATHDQPFTFVNHGDLTIGAVGDDTGVNTATASTSGGQVKITAVGSTLSVNLPIFSGARDINLFGNRMHLGAAVNAGGGRVDLATDNPADTIALGDFVSNAFSLLQSDFNQITAGVLQIGVSSGLGDVIVVAPFSSPTAGPGTWNTLELWNGDGKVLASPGAVISAPHLAVRSATAIGGADPLEAAALQLAFASGGDVNIKLNGPAAIAAVDGLTASSSAGFTTLAVSGRLAFQANVNVTGGMSASTSETTDENGQAVEDDLTINAGVQINAGGPLSLNAADNLTISTSALVQGGIVALFAGFGDADQDAALTQSGVISGAAVGLTAPGDIRVNGTVTAQLIGLNSTAGAILGDASQAHLLAGDLSLAAATGIGADGAPLLTQVSHLVAQTVLSGGIYIDNNANAPSPLTIGFANDLFQGVTVHAGTGDIVLTNHGTINITNSGEAVVAEEPTGAGNITIDAVGPGANIVTGGNQKAVAIVSRSLNVATLMADGDLVLGTAGQSGGVQGGGSVVLHAGGDISLDEGTSIQAYFALSGITATAGGSIFVNASTKPGASFNASTFGPVVLATGPGGGVYLQSAAVNGGISTNSGPVSISADHLILTAGIHAENGVVTLKPATDAEPIDLGASSSAGKLGISQADLSQISAAAVRIGDSNNSGDITISADIVQPLSWNTLSLATGGAITEADGAKLRVTNLAVQAAGDVDIVGGSVRNEIFNLAGVVTNPGAIFLVWNTVNLNVGVVDGVSGISVNGGQTVLSQSAAGATLTVTQPIVSGGGDITLVADALSLQAAVNSGPGRTTLASDTPQWPVVLGTPAPNSLSLTQSDLNQISASVLQIGNSTRTNGIAINSPISAPLDAPGTWTTLDLENANSIFTLNGGKITAPNLAIRAGGGIANGNATPIELAVSNLAFADQGSLTWISNQGPLTIAIVDGINTSTSALLTKINVVGGSLTFAANLMSGNMLTATTMESAAEHGSSGADDKIIVAQNATVEVLGLQPPLGQLPDPSIYFHSADGIELRPGAVVKSDLANVSLSAGEGDTDNDAAVLIQGTLSGVGVSVSGASALTIDYGAGASLPNGLTYYGAAGATLAVTDAGSASAHSYQISDTAIVRDAAPPISFDPHVTSVTVTGGDSPTAGDTFRVTPSLTTAFNVNGGLPNPPALPGDTLIVPQGGTLTQTIDRTTGASGKWQFAGDKPINFAGIEPAAAAATITSGNQTTFTIGVPGTFTIASDGYPPPTFNETGALPTGVTLDGATGVLAGTPAIGSAGSYQITITAHNGQGPDITQNFTLLVVAPAPTARPDTFVLSGSASSNGAGATGVLANDLSNDGQQQALTVSLVSPPVHGALTLHADGSFSYAPNASFHGIDRFSYQVSEGATAGNTVTVTLLSYTASLVDKLYHQVLGRSAEDGGLQYWAGLIAAGQPYSVVAQGIFESNERLDPIITQYYQQYLLRQAEPSGLAYWRDQVWKRDGGPDNVISGMISSPEFFASAGASHPNLSPNAAWVTTLYERLLGREPDSQGLQFWAGNLDSHAMSRQQVVLGFVRSSENFRNLTTAFLQQYLNRAPSGAELTHYVNEFLAGASQRQIELEIIDSNEYRSTPPAPAAGQVTAALYPH